MHQTGNTERTEAQARNVELGQWMGRREAFGLMAGRCSAADVESLRRIRDDKLFESVSSSWEEFCSAHLRVTRRSADREIGYLNRFGPAFFTIRQIAQVSVREYESIAAQITDGGVNVDGKVVPLLPEKSAEVAGAVATLLRRNDVAASATGEAACDRLLKQIRSAVRALESFRDELSHEQLLTLAKEVMRIESAASRRGIVFTEARLVR